MASSSSSPHSQVENEARNWLELPQNVTSTILHKLGAIEILESAQKVCTTWRRICRDPAIWRTIDMCNRGYLHNMRCDLEKMAMHAINRSSGELVDISVEDFGTDELLHYITERAGQLRRLRLVECPHISDDGLSKATNKLPFLVELIIIFGNITKRGLENIGRGCPQLKSLAFNDHRSPTFVSDGAALAIAETMPGLRSLQLIGSKMTNNGLEAILNGCPHLEYLDLRHCFHVDLGGDLGKLCSERIKDLRRPIDSLDDYGFDTTVYEGYGSFDDGDRSCYSARHPSWYSDIENFSDDDVYCRRRLPSYDDSDFGHSPASP